MDACRKTGYDKKKKKKRGKNPVDDKQICLWNKADEEDTLSLPVTHICFCFPQRDTSSNRR